MQASYEVEYKAADGVTVAVPLSRAFKVEAGDSAVELSNFRFVPNIQMEPKSMGYAFQLRFLKGSKPAKIVIEDDTEEPIFELLTDNQPKLVNGDYWFGPSQFWNPADMHVNWINSLDNGVRVYRITVTLTDGSVHVLHPAVFVPGEAKTMFRNELGVK